MDEIFSLGQWIKRRRKALDMTQDELAQRVGCSKELIVKIEADARRPSKQIAERLADQLGLAEDERVMFLQAARAELGVDRLAPPTRSVPQPALVPAAALPHGTVTFLFTDIEGSTQLWAHQPQKMGAAVARHEALLREAITAAGGVVFKTVGDAVYAAFASALDAVSAAVAGQRALSTEAWGLSSPLLIRMALHSGVVEARGGDYLGLPLSRVARLLAAGHGGQILLSLAIAELVREQRPPEVTLRDLGSHRLKDLSLPEQIFQLVAPDLLTDFPPLQTLSAHRTNLPSQPTALIGREREIADVVTLLRRADVHLVTLTGPGGTGKTRLALQVAAELLDEFVHGTYFVDLAPISDPELVASTIAHALGVQVSGNELPIDQVTEHLRGKKLLLVLDNFEQILPAAPLVAALLVAAPDLKVLTSSRAPLRISGEQELPVPPLDLPDPERLPSLDVLAQSDAVRLFIERARAVKPDFMITAENAAAVAEIVFHLEGLPLAIELAAARVKLLTPQAMLPRLKQSLDLLASTARDRTDRQRTLRGAIAWSYDLLDDGLKVLFARSAVFVGGARLEQLEAVCGPAADLGRAVLDGVSELVDQSLLRQIEVDGEPRFRMLVTIREFALEKLVASAEAQAIHARHAESYGAFAEAAVPHLQGKDLKRWLDVLEVDHDNLRAALECDIDSRRVERAVRTAYALWRFWQMRGHLREGRAWSERVLALADGPPLARMKALETIGGLAYWQADQTVTAYYREAYEIAKAHGDAADRAKAAYNYSFTFSIPGIGGETDYIEGRRYLEESLLLFRELGDRAAVGRAAWALAVTYVNGSRSPDELLRGREHGLEALREHRTLGERNLFDEGWDLHLLGLIALKLNELDEAMLRFREALELFVAAADTSGMVLMFSNIAEASRQRGEIERHDVLVGAWSALSQRTGVGLADVFGATEGRATAADIPAERRPALERGLAMKADEAIAYALASGVAGS